jgi:hypothetical protein
MITHDDSRVTGQAYVTLRNTQSKHGNKLLSLQDAPQYVTHTHGRLPGRLWDSNTRAVALLGTKITIALSFRTFTLRLLEHTVSPPNTLHIDQFYSVHRSLPDCPQFCKSDYSSVLSVTLSPRTLLELTPFFLQLPVLNCNCYRTLLEHFWPLFCPCSNPALYPEVTTALSPNS